MALSVKQFSDPYFIGYLLGTTLGNSTHLHRVTERHSQPNEAEHTLHIAYQQPTCVINEDKA